MALPLDCRLGRYEARLTLMLLGGLLLRIAVFLWIPTQPVSDFGGYFMRAKSLALVGRDEVRPGLRDSSHPPAYPILLAAVLRLAPSADDLLAAKSANAALAIAAALLGADLARRLWGDEAGLWTAALLSFFPRSILMADLIASENLFAPLFLLFLLLASRRWTGAPSFRLAVLTGASVGLLTLTRSVAYLLPVVWLAGFLGGAPERRRVVAELALLLAVEHAILLPYAIHNQQSIGRFTFFSTVGGEGLFVGNNPRATGDWYPWIEDLERLHPGVSARGALAIDDAARQEAIRWIRANPVRAAALYVRKLRLILTDDAFVAGFTILGERVLPGFHLLKAHPRAVRLGLRAAGLLLALTGLGGFVILVRRAREGSAVDRTLAAGFAAAALYVPVVSAVIAVNGRYRWPSEDVIMPLAGLWLSRKESKRGQS